MSKYTIELCDGQRYEVPENANVFDNGSSISVETGCVCTGCGNAHGRTIANWPRSEIRYASVSAHGLSMVIVDNREGAS